MELPGPVAFIDGECMVCDRTVRGLMARDRERTLHFAALQGDTAAALAAERNDFPTDVNTFVLVEPTPPSGAEPRILVRTDAILRSLDLTGGRPLGARVAGWLPRFLRDAGYRAFVRFRYRLFGRKDSCSVPTPEERSLVLP